MNNIATINYFEGQSEIFLVEKNNILPEDSELTIFDSNTAPLFLNRDPERSLVLPPGETAKSWASVERIVNRALAVSMGRDGLITGVGGGVVTDVTAFAASIYMRGCGLILVPTTLLAMVDATIGGKTGVDFGGMKNLIGTFYPAQEVRIYPALLNSLPQREYLSGMAEVIKHAMLAPGKEGGLWDMILKEKKAILNRDPDTLVRIITEAVQVKAHIVAGDLQEKGQRAVLNLGHTFAHALETATNFSRWSHGEAVAWGILRALDLGQLLSVTEKKWSDACRHLIAEYGFDIVTPQVAPDEIKAAMSADKKKHQGRLRFVLMEGPGKPILQEVPEADLDKVLGIESSS